MICRLIMAGGVRMQTLMQDIRFSLRMLAKNPGFATIAIITLALGIGATTTIFSWIDSTLLNPIRGAAATRDLVSLMKGETSDSPTPPFSYLDYLDLRERNRSFSAILAYHDDYMSLTGGTKTERVYGALTSANYFDVLGVRPVLGRTFLPEEEQKPGGAPVVVIGYGLWQGHLGGDRSAIGRAIEINRQLYTIVGVAPPAFEGCKTGLRTDLWIPLVMVQTVWKWDPIPRRDTSWLQLVGRLRPGVSRREARADLSLLMHRIVEEFPDSHRGPNQITIDPLWRSPFGANVYLYRSLPMLLAMAVVLLLLACANVANLVVVRSIGRRREVAIRLAMGATRARLVRQFLAESLILALAAGGVAILFTTWSAGTFGAFIPPSNIPLALNGQVDVNVLLAAVFIAILAGVIFGILPALRTSRLAPVAVLKEEAGSVSGTLHKARLANALVVTQIALSLLLLISAGLFVRSLQNVERAELGFDPNHVLIASYELSPVGYSRVEGEDFHRQLLTKLQTLPGVESATLADWVPLSFEMLRETIEAEGYVPRLHENLETRRAAVGPDYLQTLRIPLVVGRDFNWDDTEKSRPVAMVNQAFARRYWPGEDAIGKRVRLNDQWLMVIGVVRNGKYHLLTTSTEPIVYIPLLQHYSQYAIVQARVSGDPLAFASELERTIGELNPNLPVFNVTSLKSSIRLATIFQRIAGTFMGTFGLLALLLAAVGIYGVIAYTTRQRTHEIGIRMALGAKRADVFRLVLGQGLGLTLVGLLIGLGVSLAVTRFLRAQLYGVTSTDTLTYAGVSALLCLVALAACFFPARRATRVQPMVALRHE